MARRIPSKVESKLKIETMFPGARLTSLKASETVRSMTPKDLLDLRKAFSFNPEKVDNKKVQSLTIEDLHTLESLFRDYRMEIVATYRAGAQGDFPSNQRGTACCCSCSCGGPDEDIF
jgi:hypothetical protein